MKLTKEIVLEDAMCDELSEVRSLNLREKNINKIESDKKSSFNLDDLCNLECLIASHNLISDIGGVCQLVTLVDLNLSFNFIRDLNGIQELTLLRSLYLNHNRIIVIDSLAALKGLK